jgi:hypothetical protein
MSGDDSTDDEAKPTCFSLHRVARGFHAGGCKAERSPKLDLLRI